MIPAVRTRSRSTRVWLALAACGVAAAANYFGPPLLLRHSLVLGSTVYWVALGLLGPRLALLALLASFGSLWAMWGEPFSGGILFLEAFWVGLAWRKGRNPLVADVLFWLVLGGPLAWFVFAHLLELSRPSFELALILQPVNGFIALWFAYIINELLGVRRSDTLPARPQSFARVLAKRYMAFGTIPLLAAALLVAHTLKEETVQQSRSNLRQVALGTAEALRRFLDEHVAVVEHAALRKNSRDAMDPAQLVAELDELHRQHPRFISMLATDANGLVIAAAPGEARRAIAQQLLHVADRAYFQVPRETRQPYVSPVFRGRGFGQDLIVAVSAPCIAHDGEWLGVLEGSLTVATVRNILEEQAPSARWRALLTDSNHRVVEAHDLPEHTPYSRIGDRRLLKHITDARGEPRNLVVPRGDRRETVMTATVPVIGYDWAVTVQRPMTEVLRPVILAYLTTLAIGAITALGAWLLVRWSIRDLLAAWRRILQFSEGSPPAVLESLDESSVPLELAHLTKNLRALSSHAESERRQREQLLTRLETLVQERTRELEQALRLARSAEKAKDTFLATVSHELRTPLTSLVTGVRLLRLSGADATDVGSRTLETMERSSQVLMDVISDVLDFSKMQSGAMTLEPKPFAPAELLGELRTIIAPRLEAKGVRFSVRCDYDRTLRWNQDARRLRQVLLNLLGNAAKFTEQGEVRLTSWIDGDRLYFSVADSGPGVAEEQRASIFEPFVQLRSNHEPSIAGTGLGLSISQSLTRLMGGQISVESKPGRGARFTFWIRASGDAASAERTQPRATQP